MPDPTDFRNKLRILYVRCVYLLLVLLSFGACDTRLSNKHGVPSFYYWKSIVNLNVSETAFLDKVEAQKLYVKFFDVAMRGRKMPQYIAKTRIDWEEYPNRFRLCPVVFIVNEVFYDLPVDSIAPFARQTLDEVQGIAGERRLEEIQIDCDWSKGTKEKYFAFLETLRELEPRLTLSATIRLHQIKYRDDAGIPPVARGMLMVYNLKNPTLYDPVNSIFDKQEVKKYLVDQEVYPLHLDIALPLFSWGIHFQDQRFQAFLRRLNHKKIEQLDFLKHTEGCFYQVLQDTVFQNEYLRFGDEVKLEEVGMDDLYEGLRYSLPILPNDTFDLALFHLEEELLNFLGHEELYELFKRID